MVKEYKGAYSGEHGDGLVRSEWIAPFFGPRLTAALGEIKSWLDPRGLMNPGKIVNPSRMDDRSALPLQARATGRRCRPAALDWSEWGGFDKAVEMCNNNGHCRKFDAGTMCPSYRATRDEQHLTRGRANTLRLALSGQLGDDGRAGGQGGARPLRLVQGLQARMPDRRRHGAHEDRVPGALQGASHGPRCATAPSPTCRAMRRGRRAWHRSSNVAVVGARKLRSASRPSASCRAGARDFFDATGRSSDGDVILFVDTFNRYFEPENARAAIKVLEAAGYRVQRARAACAAGARSSPPGMVEEAKQRSAARCSRRSRPVSRARRADRRAGAVVPVLAARRVHRPAARARTALAKAPCCSRSSSRASPASSSSSQTEQAGPAARPLPPEGLRRRCRRWRRCSAWFPGLKVKTVETSCCGMAGSFGYEAEHYEVSMKMAELSLLPAVRMRRKATCWSPTARAAGTRLPTARGRKAVHVARLPRPTLALAPTPREKAPARRRSSAGTATGPCVRPSARKPRKASGSRANSAMKRSVP